MGKRQRLGRKRSKSAKAQSLRRKMEKDAADYLQSVMLKQDAGCGFLDLEGPCSPIFEEKTDPLANQDAPTQDDSNLIDSEIKTEETIVDLPSPVNLKDVWPTSSETNTDPIAKQVPEAPSNVYSVVSSAEFFNFSLSDKQHGDPRYTEEEKQLFLSIMKEQHPIIANKRNALTLNQTWDAIAVKFNARTKGAKRMGFQLKTLHKTMRKEDEENYIKGQVQSDKTLPPKLPTPKDDVVEPEIAALEYMESETTSGGSDYRSPTVQLFTENGRAESIKPQPELQESVEITEPCNEQSSAEIVRNNVAKIWENDKRAMKLKKRKLEIEILEIIKEKEMILLDLAKNIRTRKSKE